MKVYIVIFGIDYERSGYVHSVHDSMDKALNGAKQCRNFEGPGNEWTQSIGGGPFWKSGDLVVYVEEHEVL